MALQPIAVVPTRTMKVLTRTSKPIQNQKLAKSSIQIIKAVAQTAMLRWEREARIVMLARRLQYQNARRRSQNWRNDDPASHSETWQGLL
jgi:hypothetical protein